MPYNDFILVIMRSVAAPSLIMRTNSYAENSHSLRRNTTKIRRQYKVSFRCPYSCLVVDELAACLLSDTIANNVTQFHQLQRHSVRHNSTQPGILVPTSDTFDIRKCRRHVLLRNLTGDWRAAQDASWRVWHCTMAITIKP